MTPGKSAESTNNVAVIPFCAMRKLPGLEVVSTYDGPPRPKLRFRKRRTPTTMASARFTRIGTRALTIDIRQLLRDFDSNLAARPRNLPASFCLTHMDNSPVDERRKRRRAPLDPLCPAARRIVSRPYNSLIKSEGSPFHVQKCFDNFSADCGTNSNPEKNPYE